MCHQPRATSTRGLERSEPDRPRPEGPSLGSVAGRIPRWRRAPPRPGTESGAGDGLSRQFDRLEVQAVRILDEHHGVPVVELIHLDNTLEAGDRLIAEPLLVFHPCGDAG